MVASRLKEDQYSDAPPTTTGAQGPITRHRRAAAARKMPRSAVHPLRGRGASELLVAPEVNGVACKGVLVVCTVRRLHARRYAKAVVNSIELLFFEGVTRGVPPALLAGCETAKTSEDELFFSPAA